MKPLSFYSLKKRDKFLWIPVILFFVFAYACGPSKEELEYKAMHPEPGDNPTFKYVTVKTSDCGCSDITLQYYDANGHQYLGRLNNTSSDHIAHAGECKRCIQITDSLMKKNLKEFFQIKK